MPDTGSCICVHLKQSTSKKRAASAREDGALMTAAAEDAGPVSGVGMDIGFSGICMRFSSKANRASSAAKSAADGCFSGRS